MDRPVSFYSDEQIARAVIRGLRHRGADVLTAAEAGLLSSSDESHLARALTEDRVIITQDMDFLRLHSHGLEHAGIAYAPQYTPIGTIIRGVLLIRDVLQRDDMHGRVEFIG